MRSLILFATITMMLCAATMPAKANTTTNLGAVSNTTTFGDTINCSTTAGCDFTDTFNFTLGGPSRLFSTITTTFTTTAQKISGLTLALVTVSGTTSAPGTYFGAVDVGGAYAFIGAFESGGTYALTVSGNSAGAAGGTANQYTGTLSVSAVPLPASLPMFGAAIFALGAVGFAAGRKRRGSPATRLASA